jgi:hypothetical protein
MIHGEWRLIYPGVDFLFGSRSSTVFNRTSPEIGTPEIQIADNDRPRGDGRAFGVDYYGGQTLAFDLGVRAATDAEVRQATAALRHVWRADAVRQTPGAVAELRAYYGGRERVVFGRPRRFSPDYSDATVNNLVSVLADFDCTDDLWYAPEDDSVEFGIVPPLGGGLEAPLASPLSTTRTSDRSQAIRVESEEDVWPVITITGPVANPVVSIGDRVRLEVRVDLNHDEELVIDTRPWHRTALRNGSASVAGSVRGTRLSQASLPPGRYEVGLQGLDPTGTARVRVAWRRTYPAL